MSARPASASVVVIGGGHGCSRSLAALRRLEVQRTAVVTVADDGGSSGRLRRDHDVVALGDLRMALLALAADEGGAGAVLRGLARHRFGRGELEGHSLGNLMLLALLEAHDGDVVGALDDFAGLVGAVGRVLPATSVPVTLHARTAAGPVSGQAAVATARRIERVNLDPPAPEATPEAVSAIDAADVVLLGPGSLYTSILPVLLVPGVAMALARTPARVVLVGNLREQPGETEGMCLADHAEALLQHVPGLRIDVVIAHEREEGTGTGPRSARPLDTDLPRLLRSVGSVVRSDLGEELDGHDPGRLAVAVAGLLGGRDAAAPLRSGG